MHFSKVSNSSIRELEIDLLSFDTKLQYFYCPDAVYILYFCFVITYIYNFLFQKTLKARELKDSRNLVGWLNISTTNCNELHSTYSSSL